MSSSMPYVIMSLAKETLDRITTLQIEKKYLCVRIGVWASLVQYRVAQTHRIPEVVGHVSQKSH